MQQSKDSFLVGRIKGAKFALKGAIILIRTEASIKVQFSIGVLITIAGFYFNISTTEWMLQIFAIGMVMSIEGLNTAVEEIADFIHPDYHHKIGLIKDIAAGAVFMAAFAASIIGLIIYLPKIF